MVVEFLFGRPSSTSGAVLFLALVYAVPAAFGGLVVALIALAVLRYRSVIPFSEHTYKLIVGIPCVLAIGLGTVKGVPPVMEHIRANRPRIVHDEGRVRRSEALATCTARFEAISFYRDVSSPIFSWRATAASKIRVKYTGGGVSLVDENGQRLSVTALDALDPVFSAEAIPFGADPVAGTTHLAVLVQLRPTSNHDVLLVYDASARLIYEEILERQGPLWRCDHGVGPMGNTIHVGTEVAFATQSSPLR
jgi:hypothetical protein